MRFNYFPLKNNAKKKQLKVIYNDESTIGAAQAGVFWPNVPAPPQRPEKRNLGTGVETHKRRRILF